jgi:hypothetical protein
MDILEDLEILILNNEDDFDRGKGKYILQNFIKEKQAEQLILSSVSQQRELLIAELNKTDLEYIQQQGCTDILAEDLLKAINCG